MRCTAEIYASRVESPAAALVLANSTTTIAPSINIPSDNNRPNITMKLKLYPNELTTINAPNRQNGMPNPTNNPDLTPNVATTNISTKHIAVMILPCNSLIMSLVITELSKV